MYKKRLILSVCLLFFSTSLFAQINYNVYAKGGISNFIEKNHQKNFKIANSYTILPSFNIGAEVILPFFNSYFSDLQLITGLDLGTFAAKNNMPDSFEIVETPYTGPRSWDERFYSVSIPVRGNFQFEKWVHVFSV